MSHKLEDRMEELLGEDARDAIAREGSEFDRQACGRSGLILFGSGLLGRRTLAGLRKGGIPVLAFCDNDARRWRTKVDGLEVLSPADAVHLHGQQAVFVVTIWPDAGGHPLEQITRQLGALGPARVVSVAFLYWKYPRLFLPYFCLDLPHRTLAQAAEARECLSLWADERSREEFVAQLGWRLRMDFQDLSPRVTYKPYLPDEMFALSPGEVFVDCGAFDGDTLRDFLQEREEGFGHYHALEPDRQNFEKILSCLEAQPPGIRAKVTPRCLAVGSHAGEVCFDASGTAQSAMAESGGSVVPCAPIDDLFPGREPSYIKMDIEGAEGDALRGASQTIQAASPILAICVYHRFDHLWKLPLLIRSFSDDYRFFLRPHADPFWDLVCYAVPKARCIG